MNDETRVGVLLPTGRAQLGAGTDPRTLIDFAVFTSSARACGTAASAARFIAVTSSSTLACCPGLADLGRLGGAHHERLDGSGYPHGLRADEIPLPARLLAVADVFEAITATRPYRQKLSPADALAHLRAEARAGRLDADSVEALAAAVG